MLAQVDVRCSSERAAEQAVERLRSMAPRILLRRAGYPDRVLVRFASDSVEDARRVDRTIAELLVGIDGIGFGGLTLVSSGDLGENGELVQGGQAVDWPGDVDGRHYTEWVDTVRSLRRAGDELGAEALLLRLVDATEAESAQQGVGVAPWYYEQLATIYSKRGGHRAEIEILERFASQAHAPGTSPPRLMERLDRARRKLA